MTDAVSELRRRVAVACRIVALDGFVDLTLGHVSAREPGTDRVWIKRKGVSLDEVETEDIIAIDLDDPAALDGPELHLESVMHTEVYRLRPDVGSVIHGHPPYATALGATTEPLRMLTHDAVLFADGIGEFDEGPSLVTDPVRGRRVAEALGAHRAALLRNHGVVLAGEDVRWSTLAAVTLERAIRFQTTVAALGPPKEITPEDALALRPQKYPPSLLDDYWAAWERRVDRARVPVAAGVR